MSRDTRSILRLLFVVSCISCVVYAAPADSFAFTFQEQETEQLIEELEEQLKQETEKLTQEPVAESKPEADESKPEANEEAKPAAADDSAGEIQEESGEEITEETGDEIVAESTEGSAEESDDGADGAAAMVIPDSGEKEMLTPKSIQWLWNLLFLFLTICFLGWLLSLMTRKPEETTVESSANSDASGKDLDFGKVYAARPSTVDDLTKIGGIDAAAEKRLNDAGIWQYDQLRKMTAQQRANLQRKLNLPRIRWYSLSGLGGGSSTDGSSTGATDSTGTVAGAAGAVAAGAAATAALASGSRDKGTGSASNGAASGGDKSSLRVDSELGDVHVRPPKFRDDLTKLKGVDAKTAAKMNEAGVYSFKQIEALSPVQRLAFEKRFGVSVASLNLGAAQASTATTGQGGSTTGQGGSASSASTTSNGGRASSAGTATGATSGGASSSSASAAAPGVVSGFASPSAKASPENGSSGNSSSGSGSQTPTSSSQGGSSRVAGASSGSRAGDAARSASATASASLSLTDLVSKGKGRMDDTFGFLYTSPPADADDLTKLVGIDADAAKRLNAAGIYKFDQLSSLDESQTSALARRFRLPDADFSDWRRCFYAWGRGIATTAEADEVYGKGMLHGIELPQIASGVFEGDKLVAYPEQTIFRGSNPEGWGRGNLDGIEGVETSLSSDAIRSDINYLRIRRADTRESVVVPMTKGNIFSNGGENENGWNGSSEVFFGGRHIGAFAQDLPQEVETKFSQGGWGFGHRYDHNDRQEWGWGGRVIEPTTFEVSVGCIGNVPGTVVFRSSDPSIWNTRARDGETRFAVPLDSVSHPVNFVRIMREATGEAVIVRVDGNHILDEGFDPRCGWNGSGSEFSGGMHLGAYHSDLPQDFETRFEFGGWGFGHPYDDNDRQSWGWAGRQLPETVFEISLLESVPEFMQHELIE